MSKLAIIDLDGVIVDPGERFKQAEEVRQGAMPSEGSLSKEQERELTSLYWRTVFDPTLVELDTLIAGANEALLFIEGQGYDIVLLSSRPESMREATEMWLFEQDISSPDDLLILKAPAFQYVKTVIWKTGMVQTLAATLEATTLLIIDDEQVILDEHLKDASSFPARLMCKSLAEAVARLNGTWVEPDPFL